MAYEVKNKNIEKIMKKIGEGIKNLLPRGWGFTLFIFDYSDEKSGNMFYMSSAKRDDMINALIEFISKQKTDQTKN